MPASPQPYPSWAKLRAVAAAQRRVVLLFLVALVGNFAATPLAGLTGEAGVVLVMVGVLVVLVAMVISVYRLARALESRAAWAWALVCWVSLLGLVTILILNRRATTLLQRAGIKVGFLGVSSLPERPPPGVRTSDVADVFG